MPGKAHMGLDDIRPGTQSGKTKVSRAYCEGRQANENGALVTANPFPDTKSETFEAWDTGWQDKEAGLISARSVGCST